MRALSRWPSDALRPDCQFRDVLSKRFLRASTADTVKAAQAVPSSSAVDEAPSLAQANALYSLLENRYSRTVCA